MHAHMNDAINTQNYAPLDSSSINTITTTVTSETTMSSREQSTDPYVWAVLGVFGTCVSCVGLILNLICTVTWIKHGFRPSTIVYFIALSVIDSCMLVSVQLLFCFPALLPPDSYYDDIYAVVWSVVYPFEQVGLTSFH